MTADYQQRWGVIYDLTTSFIAIYFLLQVVMSWTVNCAGFSARLYAELFIPPFYALTNTSPEKLELQSVLLVAIQKAW